MTRDMLGPLVVGLTVVGGAVVAVTGLLGFLTILNFNFGAMVVFLPTLLKWGNFSVNFGFFGFLGGRGGARIFKRKTNIY